MKLKSKINSVLKAGMMVTLFCAFALVADAQLPKGKPWKAPDAAVKMKNPNTVDDAFIAAGKSLYNKHCKSCHGSGGKGDGPKAANLEISSGDFTSDEFKAETEGTVYWKTTEGRDPMPTFKKKVTDEERWQIVAYIGTLGKKK
jgi:mono/diheme cytochrome c family protein